MAVNVIYIFESAWQIPSLDAQPYPRARFLKVDYYKVMGQKVTMSKNSLGRDSALLPWIPSTSFEVSKLYELWTSIKVARSLPILHSSVYFYTKRAFPDLNSNERIRKVVFIKWMWVPDF